ncbi:MAG: hypothetical protein H7840_17030 [Alphaproteobacteria bacterium]
MDDMSKTFAAVAFAEENEHETARAIAAEKTPAGKGGGGGSGPSVLWVVTLGVAVSAVYGLLFLWQEDILRITARGSWTFIMPVAIAFIFSLVHGAFTSGLWTVCGLTAKK